MIYVGTFSKVLFPGLRLDYMVVPAHVVDAFTIAKTVCDYHCPTIQQSVVAEFINEAISGGKFGVCACFYCERLEILLEAARTEMNDALEIERPDAGMLWPGSDREWTTTRSH